MAHCEEVLIISRCVYGSYSPFVKNILDRSISYVLPFFVKRNNEIHHQMRYNNTPALSVRFYGEKITEAEKNTAEALVQANITNMNMKLTSIHFSEDATHVMEVV